jgi:hypothetical protein
MSIYGGVDVNAPDSSISSIEGPNQGTGEGTLSPATMQNKTLLYLKLELYLIDNVQMHLRINIKFSNFKIKMKVLKE